MPTEHQLVSHYGVSRATVRTALQGLEAMGLVNVRRGSGTYAVSPLPVVAADLRSLESMRATIARHHMEPATEWHRFEPRAATPEQCAVLDLEQGQAVLETARAIRADGDLVAYSFETIPLALLDGWLDGSDTAARIGDYETLPDPSEIESLFELLDLADARPTTSNTQIHCCVADERFERFVEPGALFLRLDQLHRDGAGRPVALSSSYYVEGHFNFVLTRTRPPGS